MSQTYTSSETYSVTDVEVVVRRVKADLIMIASSTGAVSEETAKEWAHDVEILAKNGYLKMVDLTLFSNDVEYMAAQFKVNTESGDLTTSRPGAMWPRLPNPYLRIVLSYTAAYDAAAKEKMRDRLMIGWTPTNADTSHSTLTSDSGRDYVSNGYGMQRKDFSR